MARRGVRSGAAVSGAWALATVWACRTTVASGRSASVRIAPQGQTDGAEVSLDLRLVRELGEEAACGHEALERAECGSFASVRKFCGPVCSAGVRQVFGAPHAGASAPGGSAPRPISPTTPTRLGRTRSGPRSAGCAASPRHGLRLAGRSLPRHFPSNVLPRAPAYGGKGTDGASRPQRLSRQHLPHTKKPIPRRSEDGHPRPSPNPPPHPRRYTHPHRTRTGAAGMHPPNHSRHPTEPPQAAAGIPRPTAGGTRLRTRQCRRSSPATPAFPASARTPVPTGFHRWMSPPGPLFRAWGRRSAPQHHAHGRRLCGHCFPTVEDEEEQGRQRKGHECRHQGVATTGAARSERYALLCADQRPRCR
ncbi:hypothetical protein SALBM311S_08415 [Streptomyces alboniger]